MKLLKKHFFSVLAVTASLFAGAQSTLPQRDVWVVGKNLIKFDQTTGGVNAITTAPVHAYTISKSWQPAGGSVTNAYHDENGNLLFYISNSWVYDWEGRFIGSLLNENSTINDNKVTGNQDIVIIPDKCNPRIFYIVASNETEARPGGPPHGLDVSACYTKLEIGTDINMINAAGQANDIYDTYGDMHADGRLGFATSLSLPDYTNPSNVILGTSMIPLVNPASPGVRTTLLTFALSKVQADGERLLFICSGSQTRIYKASDLATAGNTNTSPTPLYNNYLGGNQNPNLECELYQAQGSNIIRMANRLETIPGPNPENFICREFIYSAGAITTGTDIKLTDPGTNRVYYGMEFSPNGRYLYFTSQHHASGLSCFDLLNPAAYPVDVYYTGFAPFTQSQIETGKNGSLYFCSANALGELSGPNGPLSANFTTHSMPNTVLQSSYEGFPFYSLNDQVDGEPPYPATNYGNTEPEAACCIEHKVYTSDVFVVSGDPDQTWSPGAGNNPFGSVSGMVAIKSRLVIPAGYKVTINNMIFEFKPFMGDPATGTNFVDGAKCILERSTVATKQGGELVLNNTTFKGLNTCYYGMWDGIEVQGDPNKPQQILLTNPTGIRRYQSRLMVNSGSVIEDAYFGAANYQFDLTLSGTAPYMFSPMLSNYKSGGIIVSYGGTFKNNHIGVVFMPYYNTNVLSSFKSSSFLIDAPLKNPLIKPYALAYLNNVKNMPFIACQFKNLASTAYPIVPATQGDELYGIFSYNASFVVRGNILVTTSYNAGCVFENLGYGIWANNYTNNTILLQSSVFKNNWRGSYYGNFNDVSATKTQRNKYFIYEQPTGTMASEAAYGHYLDYCSNFIVQENLFYYNSYDEITAAPVGSQYNVYGCIVNEENPSQTCEVSGYKGDEIYRNLFKEINVGAQAQGYNAEAPRNLARSLSDPAYAYPCHGNGSDHDQGLKYTCNTFVETDENDIAVMIDGSGAHGKEGRIAFRQGGGIAAGNSFSHINNGAVNCTAYSIYNYREIFIDQTNVDNTKPNYLQYYFDNSAAKTPYCYSPLSMASHASLYNTGLFQPVMTNANTCPTRMDIPVSGGVINPGVLVEKHKLKGIAINTANIPLVMGDAQDLLDLIANGSSGDIVTGLLNKSPYLSDRVLVAAMGRGLDEVDLRSILIANSPVSSYIIQEAKKLTFSAESKRKFLAAQVGTSPRYTLESTVLDMKAEQHVLEVEALYTLQSDSIPVDNDTLHTGSDSLLAFVNYLGGSDVAVKRFKIYLSTNQLERAGTELNSIVESGAPLAGYYTKVKDLTIAMGQGNFELFRDPEFIAAVNETRGLEYLYDCKGAEGIAKLAGWDSDREWIQGNSSGTGARTANTEEATGIKTLITGNAFKVYPNPSGGTVSYDYKFEENNEAVITVYNLMGATLLTTNTKGASGHGTLNLSELPGGLYFITVLQNSEKLYSVKIEIVK